MRQSIFDFWNWFESNERYILDSIESVEVGDEIDDHLARVSDELGWEYGPTENSGLMYFSVSPNLNRNHLKLAHLVIAAAYKSQIWEFRLGRQAKPWSEVICLGLDSSIGEVIEVDLKTLSFSLSLRGGVYDARFGGCLDERISHSDAVEVCELVVMNSVGELVAMSKVGAISYDKDYDGDYSSKEFADVLREKILMTSRG